MLEHTSGRTLCVLDSANAVNKLSNCCTNFSSILWWILNFELSHAFFLWKAQVVKLKVVVYPIIWWKSSNALVPQALVSSCGLWQYRGFARHGAATLCQQEPASHLAYLYHNLEPCRHPHQPTRSLGGTRPGPISATLWFIHTLSKLFKYFYASMFDICGQTISAKEIASCIQSHVILQENAIYELLLQLLQ